MMKSPLNVINLIMGIIIINEIKEWIMLIL